ncbi:hypothetical protein QZH41_016712, partial [Actinostola sp. cb2023]
MVLIKYSAKKEIPAILLPSRRTQEKDKSIKLSKDRCSRVETHPASHHEY